MAGGEIRKESVSIGTWNIHGWCDGRGMESVERIKATISRHKLDVLFLQEVNAIPASPAIHERLKVKVGKKREKIYSVLAKSLGFSQIKVDRVGSCGNAIFSMYPLEDVKVVDLPHGRHAVLARILVESAPLELCCFHADHMEERSRLAEWEKLREVIEEWSKGHTLLLGGDLNALTRSDFTDETWEEIRESRRASHWFPPESLFMDLLREEGFVDGICALPEGEKSLGTSRFDTRIDYLLLRPPTTPTSPAWTFSTYEVDKKSDGSDHRLVKTTILPKGSS